MYSKMEAKIVESKQREAAHVASFFEHFHSTDTAQLAAIKEAIPASPAAKEKSSGLLPKVARAQSRGWFLTLLASFFHR